MYTAYMAPSPGCTGPEGDRMSRAAGARPQDRPPAGRPPSSWSRVAGDPYGSKHGPAGPGSCAPRFRVSALAQRRQGAAAAGATAAPGGLGRPRGSASGAPKIELSRDPGSHCGRTQERVGSRTGAEAAQGRRPGPCPPQDPRMGSPLRVSPAERGEVLGALPGAEAQPGEPRSVEAGRAETPGRKHSPNYAPAGAASAADARLVQGGLPGDAVSRPCSVFPRRATPPPPPKHAHSRRTALTGTGGRVAAGGPAGPSTSPSPQNGAFRASCPLLPPEAWHSCPLQEPWSQDHAQLSSPLLTWQGLALGTREQVWDLETIFFFFFFGRPAQLAGS